MRVLAVAIDSSASFCVRSYTRENDQTPLRGVHVVEIHY